MQRISVVIPVYNVEAYLEQCLKSVCEQSFCDIEIILINDGSTDRSGGICKQWEAQDKRIIYVEKENEGQGMTKNLGLKIATAEYIAFIDSDDWVAPDYLAQLLKTISKNDADICFCDYYEYWDGKLILVRKSRFAAEDENFREKLILYGSVGTTKLYKKKFLLDNELWMPKLYYEDTAIYPISIVCAGKISFEKKPMYYYRKHSNSITANAYNKLHFPKVIEYCINQFIRKNTFNKYYRELEMYAVRRTFMILRGVDACLSNQLKKNLFAVLDDHFINWRNYYDKNWVVLGSFNLKWIVDKLYTGECYPHGYLGFSSVISQFAGKTDLEDSYLLHHPNLFRQELICKDIGSWMKNLSNEKLNDIDGLFLDFSGERFDIIRTMDDVYMTKSEAFDEADFETSFTYQVIKNDSDEYMDLWEQSCLTMIEFLKSNFQGKRIILIKVRLAEKYEKDGIYYLYDDAEQIRTVNDRIEKMERFFSENYVGIDAWSLPPEKIYSGDDNRYGSFPWYLNIGLYEDLAWDISEKIYEEAKRHEDTVCRIR